MGINDKERGASNKKAGEPTVRGADKKAGEPTARGANKGAAARPARAAGQGAGQGVGSAGGQGGKRRKFLLPAAIAAVALILAIIIILSIVLWNSGKGAPDSGGAEGGIASATSAAATTASEAQPEGGASVSESEAIAIEIPETGAAPLATTAAPELEPDGGAPPVAELAGQKISQPDFRYMLNYFKSMILLNSGIEAGSEEERNFWEQDVGSGETMLDYAKENTLASLEELMICVSLAGERGIGLDEDDLENVSTQIQMLMDRFGGADELELITQVEYGVSVAELAAINERFLLRQKVFDAEKDAMTVDDGEALSYYELNSTMYDTATVRHILFLYEGGDASEPRTDEQSRELAEDMLARVRAGEDMAALAAEYSEDGGVASNGGVYTFGRDDNLVQEFIDWSFAAEIGDTGIVETSYGYHVMRLDARDLVSFEDAKPSIVDAIKGQRLESVVMGWMSEPKYAAVVNEEVLASII
jgi:foldase protein PrsA